MMKRRLWLLAAVAAAALGLQSPAARADFEYGTSVTPGTVTGSSSGSTLTENGIGSFPTPTAPAFSTPTDIKVADVFVTDNSTGSDYTDTYNVGVSVDVAITDLASGKTGTVTLTGTLTGTVTRTTSASGIVSFGAVWGTNPFDSASQTVTIGGTVYTVSAIPGSQFQAPGPPNGDDSDGNHGGYAFHVTSTPAGRVPELDPGCMAGALTFLCGGVLTVMGKRRRN